MLFSMFTDNPLLVQIIAYAIAGVIATLVHIAVFHLLAWKLFPALQADDYLVKLANLPTMPINDTKRAQNAMQANTLAFLFSTLTAYVLNVQWVFEPGKHSFIVELGLFYAVAAISILFASLLMGALIRYFSMLTSYAFVSNVVCAASINFVVRKYVIFMG